jgi:hypothetical protein
VTNSQTTVIGWQVAALFICVESSPDFFIGTAMLNDMSRIVIQFLKGYDRLLLGPKSAIDSLIPVYCFMKLIMDLVVEGRLMPSNAEVVTRLMGSTEFGGEVICLTLKNVVRGTFPPPKKIARFVVPWLRTYSMYAPDFFTASSATATENLNLDPACQKNLDAFLE